MSADDRDLDAAFEAVREKYDGESPEADATLRRALLATRKETRKSKTTRWFVLPIAAALAATTAWAATTGRIHLFSDATHAPHDDKELTPAPARPVATVVPAPAAEPEPEPEPTTSAEPEAPPAPAPVVSAAKPAVAAAPSLPPSSDPHAGLFAEAHRLHFEQRDPARALEAWDRYLAVAPSGRFAPEARYNRALTLVRLGRHAEAKTALEAFANGTYGSYRRSEARALLEAMAQDP